MNRLRTGAALIIVLLILIAMMLLGLPFLYSQVWGLSGARSMQAAQSSRVYLLGTEHLGAALGTYANASAWSPTTGTNTQAQIHSALDLYLQNMPLLPINLAAIPVVEPVLPVPATPTPQNLARINPAAFGWNHGPHAQVGLELSDESGRLDPNLLDAAGWADLFQRLGIPDWDDNAVTLAWQDSLDGNDNDILPELSQELEWRRIHAGRYARIEDLRIPTPQASGRRRGVNPSMRKRLNAAEIERLRPFLSFQNRSPGRGGLTDLGSVVASDQDFRTHPTNPITDSRFIPRFVVMDMPPEAVNSGTWVMAEPSPGGVPQEGLVSMGVNHNPEFYTYNIYYRSNVLPATNSGVWLQVPPVLNVHQLRPELAGLPAYANAFRPPSGGAPAQTLTAVFANFASGQPIRFYGQPDSGNNLVPALPWDYLRPHFGTDVQVNANGNWPNPPRERQPLDIRSDGLIRIRASSTVLDAAGAIASQHQRTSIIQAVPQTQALERRWQTQGQFEPLVAQRFTSGMTTWPKATARATDQLPDDVDPAQVGGAPAAESGLSFSVNRTPASFQGGNNGDLPHLTVAWRVPMGTDAPTVRDDVLKDYRVGQNGVELATASPPPVGNSPVNTDLHPPLLSQSSGEGLFPDGVRMGRNSQLAYVFDSSGGPLRMANPLPASAPADPSLGYCHIGFWFRPESDWTTGTTPVTLMESRQGTQWPSRFKISPDLDPSVIPHGIDDQNYFAVLYDPKQNMLVACYTPPCASSVGAPIAWTAQVDDPVPSVRTPNQDERCLPDVNPANFLVPRRFNPDLFNPAKANFWSETYRPNRIMTCWKLGNRLSGSGVSSPVPNVLEKGRWYYLQVVIGNGRPGGIGIILDGLVGTDVGLMKKSDYLNTRKNSVLKGPWPGDHLTLPGLLLLDDLPAIPKGAGGQSALLFPQAIGIEMPGFSAFASDNYAAGNPSDVATPSDVIPSRGTVLIGDEYIRYENIVFNSGRYELRSCVRGFRQDTNTRVLSNTDLTTLPSTQSHVKGSRVIADGARISAMQSGGVLLTGGTNTVDVVGCGVAATNFEISGIIQSPRNNTNPFLVSSGDDVTIDNTSTGWVNVPYEGVVRIDQSNGSPQYYYYKKVNPTNPFLVRLTDVSLGSSALPGPPLSPSPFLINSPVTYASNDATPARITVISLAVEDLENELLVANKFKAPTGDRDNGVFIQLLNPSDGRCEWLAYTDILKRSGKSFFINQNGWRWNPIDQADRDRGRERTPFVSGETFPVGTLVLPVQTDGNIDRSFTKVLAPGDLVTLVPPTYSGSADPVTMLIRYCNNDGYSDLPALENDTYNGWFAFSSSLRGLIADPTLSYEIVMGTGLNTLRDLAPINAQPNLKNSATPRLDAHVDGANSGRLVLGGADVGRLGIAPTTSPMMTIDAPVAGQWNNSAGRIVRVYGTTTPGVIADQNDLPCYIEASVSAFDTLSVGSERISLVEIGGEVFACALLTEADLSDAALTAGMTLAQTANAGIFSRSAPATYLTSNRGRFAKIIARGLLGSATSMHVFTNAQTTPANMATPRDNQMIVEQQNLFGNFDLGPEFFRLPIGPVRIIAEPDLLADGKWFRMQDVVKNGSSVAQQDTTLLNAPALLISEPNRAASVPPWEGKIEILQLGGRDPRPAITGWDHATQSSITFLASNPNKNKFITAPWMRGLYNTPVQTWAKTSGGHGDVYPLAIGWWPRFASALPSATAMTPSAGPALPVTTITPQHYRSRIYSWINFPLSLHLARFDESAPFELNIDATKTMNSFLDQPDGVEIQVRAMAGAIGGRTDVPFAFAANGQRGDWSQITPQIPAVISWTGWHAVPGLFGWNPVVADPSQALSQALETDGIEVRVGFRYKSPISTSLADAARSGNRAPLISGAKLRCYAPITTIAVEDAR